MNFKAERMLQVLVKKPSSPGTGTRISGWETLVYATPIWHAENKAKQFLSFKLSTTTQILQLSFFLKQCWNQLNVVWSLIILCLSSKRGKEGDLGSLYPS
jgi:hypothetical protein